MALTLQTLYDKHEQDQFPFKVVVKELHPLLFGEQPTVIKENTPDRVSLEERNNNGQIIFQYSHNSFNQMSIRIWNEGDQIFLVRLIHIAKEETIANIKDEIKELAANNLFAIQRAFKADMKQMKEQKSIWGAKLYKLQGQQAINKYANTLAMFKRLLS